MNLIRCCHCSQWRKWASMVLLLALSNGCKKQDAGPTAADIVRRQQAQEAAAAAKPRSLDDRIREVRDYLENQNSDAAAAALRPLLIAEGSHPDVVVLSADVQAAQGNLVAAAKTLIDNLNDDSEKKTKSLFQAAGWFSDAGEYELATEALQQILAEPRINPSAPEMTRAHRQLAELLNRSGRRLSAAPHLQWLAQNGDVNEKELFAMIAYGDPFMDDSSSQDGRGQPLSPASLARAKELRHESMLPKAIDLVEMLAKKFPQSTGIAAFRGRVHADMQDFDKLIQWRSRLPAGIEAEPEYWFALGVLMDHQSHHEEAARCFAEAVARDPTDRFSYLKLSRALTSLGDDDGAECARHRFSLLDETTRLAYRFGGRAGTEAELHQLADRLQELHRDAEAIGWRMLSLKRFGGSASAIADLAAQRASLNRNGESPVHNRDRVDATDADSGRDVVFALCGLKLDNWPLPTEILPSEMNADASINASATLPATDGRRAIEVPIRLIDVAAEIGIHFQYDNGAEMASERVLLHQLTGGGIGVLDVDCDGWPDLYLTQAGGDAFDANGSQPNRLLRNLAGIRYSDITEHAQTADTGYGQGVAVADLNQDGFDDLVVANIGPNRIYINQGDGTFEQAELPAWEQDAQWTTSIACGDLSGDGLPEIVEVNYVDDPSAMTTYCTPHNTDCNPSQFRPARDRVWQWRPVKPIERRDDLWSSTPEPGYGFAAIIANTDGKAGADLFIANDRVANDFWLSQRAEPDTGKSDSATFRLTENAQLYGCATGLLGQQQGCMGVAAGDFDRNGRIDFHVTNFWNQPADLYLQDGQGFFVHSSLKRGLDDATKHTVAWGTQAVDFDRNGWLDLAVLNGHLINRHQASEPYQMRPQLFAGDASGFQLRSPNEMASANDTHANYWNRPTLGRTMAVLDWNRDLKPDLICNHLDVPVAILENQTDGGNTVQFELVGVTSERDAISAEVTVVCDRDRWTSWVTGGDGFLCSNESVLDIGIGSHDQIDEVLVKWPSGAQQRFTNIEVNRRYLLTEHDDRAFERPYLASDRLVR